MRPSDRTAETLSGKLDELARALLRSEAEPGAVAQMLETASVAALHAVALDALREGPLRDPADALDEADRVHVLERPLEAHPAAA